MGRPASPAWPIAILRPCEGSEAGLYENLLSTLRVPYGGRRRVLFLVPNASDPAYAVAQEVLRTAACEPTLRAISAEVVCTAPRPFENRKVAQLCVGLARCEEEIVVFADSDVRLQGDDLAALLEALAGDNQKAHCGAAFAAPIEVAPRTLWDRASAAVVGGSPQSFLSLYGLSALLGGAPSMAGALCALRRSALSGIGGLECVRDCLGEDNELARRLFSSPFGYRVAISAAPARCHDGGRSAREVIARVARWLAVVRAQRPGLLLGYPLFLASAPVLLVAALGLHTSLLIGFTAVVLVLRTLLACALRWFFGARKNPVVAFLEVLFAEGLLWLGFLRAVVSRRIRWRGHSFWVERGGRLRPVDRTHQDDLRADLRRDAGP